MKNSDTGDEHLVEAKVNTRFSKEALKNQLRDYHGLLDNRRKTYVLFIVFGEEKYELEMQDKRSQINSFLGEDKAEFIETIDDDVEIVLNLNPPQ